MGAEGAVERRGEPTPGRGELSLSQARQLSTSPRSRAAAAEARRQFPPNEPANNGDKVRLLRRIAVEQVP